jgi:glycosyltransferase involved in cell wall biosynthesis
MRINNLKLIYFVAVDWFFCSHFLERAKFAMNAGYEVVLITAAGRHRSDIERIGIRVIPLDIDRKSLNPFSALRTIWQLVAIFRIERPDILHQVAIKPILLGSLAARVAGVINVVNAVVGGGYAFTSKSRSMRILRPLLKFAMKSLLNPPNSTVIFENKDDLSSFVEARFVRSNAAALIRGAGVSAELYSVQKGISVTPLVIVPARLLWDKGLAEFVEAARILRNQYVKARFAIVGGEDPDNRACIPKDVLEQWRSEAVVELWGFHSDMPNVLAQADIVCLPSYREGLPKALLEGMAAGLPCVTTDVTGCSEAVIDGKNGLLVPPRDPQALADALRKLIISPDLRFQMGNCGREMAIKEFSSSIICQQTLKVYKELLQA